jgi:hypothetical protein
MNFMNKIIQQTFWKVSPIINTLPLPSAGDTAQFTKVAIRLQGKKKKRCGFGPLANQNRRGFGPLANYADRATAACWRRSANFCG